MTLESYKERDKFVVPVPPVEVQEIKELLNQVLATCRRDAPLGTDYSEVQEALSVLCKLEKGAFEVPLRSPVVTIEQDEDAPCPDEWWSEWKLVPYLSGKAGYMPPDDARFHYSGYTSYELSVFRHSCTVWSLRGSGPQCRWDTTEEGGLLVYLGEGEGPEKEAQSFLDTYNQWLEGDIFHVTISDGMGGIHDSCGGLYGVESVELYLKDMGIVNPDFRGTLSALMSP